MTDATGTGATGTVAPAPLSEREHRAMLRSVWAAPSVHGTRPCRLRLHGHRVEIWVDDQRAPDRSDQSDPRGRQVVISCGAALLNLRLAMEHLGFEARTTLCPAGPTDAHLATVARGPARAPGQETERLYRAIADRRTARGRPRPEPVARAVALRLVRAAHREGAVLHEFRTQEQRTVLHGSLRNAAEAEPKPTDRSSPAESWSWLSGDGGGDGMPVGSREGAPYHRPVAWADGALTRADTEVLAEMVERESFFLLATAADDRPAWLRAGQALQRVLLTAHNAGLGVRFLNQSIEAAALRSLLPSALDLPGAPQLLLRVG